MLTNPTELHVPPAVRALTDYLDLTQGSSPGHAVLAREMVGVLIAAGHLTPAAGPGRSSQRPAPAPDDPAAERDWWPLGDGEDDAEVWIPPRGDCVQFRFQQPCPHCDSIHFHLRTGRCADCGRRPGRG
ncbi:hypothetical protein SAMN05216207_10517 [Pseudonocardia ammonioxydans]|uniref:Uncharacterized protein n=1 Tax=Pseudonocardia ammonioxydans TaxID=260086 RepID=A0A1I5GU89_PSUAM|nr:hypothetical protein [Pseudonocardia ammonioxydans]SFO39568.1 hypothetical protein SAMN05216207_10517 [Pseudonocardia ammonioxydans]